MTIQELLEVANDIRETLSQVRKDRQLSFVEENHKYGILDPKTNSIISNLPSVSTITRLYSDKFDAKDKSLQMSDGDADKAKELQDKWKKMGDDSSSIGNYAHFKLEQYVWSLFDIEKDLRKPEYNLSNEHLLEAQEFLKNGVNLIHQITSMGFVPIETECVMGSIDLGYFGQCDNIWLGFHQNKLTGLITDYKTNKTKNFQEHHYNTPMKPPFERLKNTKLSEYLLQPSLYAQLFKDMLIDTKYNTIDFAGFRILHLRDGGTSIRTPKWVNDEIQKLYPLKN